MERQRREEAHGEARSAQSGADRIPDAIQDARQTVDRGEHEHGRVVLHDEPVDENDEEQLRVRLEVVLVAAHGVQERHTIVFVLDLRAAAPPVK